MSPRLSPAALRRRLARRDRPQDGPVLSEPTERPTERQELPARWAQGSALPEPTPDEVYEDRLRRRPVARPVVGVNFLDVDEADPVPTLASSADVHAREVEEWVPWCLVCLGEPLEVYTLGGAEYLAGQHDIVHHGGSWTARAVLACDVAEVLAAAAVRRGAR